MKHSFRAESAGSIEWENKNADPRLGSACRSDGIYFTSAGNGPEARNESGIDDRNIHIRASFHWGRRGQSMKEYDFGGSVASLFLRDVVVSG